MSRALIGGVVAVLIAVLTLAAYLVATSSLEDRIRGDVKRRVARSQALLGKTAELEGLALLKRAEALASDPAFATSIGGEDASKRNPQLAERGFKRFRAKQATGEVLPDVLALVDTKGSIVALMSGDKEVVNPIPDLYLRDGKIKYRAIDLALKAAPEKRQIVSEIWDYETIGPMKAAVAPVVDIDVGETVGAVIVAYSITADEASRQRDLLGAEVAYFYGEKVTASSFGGGKGTAVALAKPLFEGGLAKQALESEGGFADLVTIELDGEEYVATAGRLPRYSTQDFPRDYPPMTAGALVAMSVSEALAPLATVKMSILLVGVGVMIIALLAIFVTAKRILGPLDEIEVGINEIINGNIDRTFRPVGSDLDGLANALNVMLARLLGRPEPGEEEYDDEGNIVQPGALAFDSEGMSPRDQEAIQLASEPEEPYYRRLYSEYVQARKDTGESIEGVSYESFIAKLRLSEANLKTKYESRAVRFKIVTKDGKVTLKPVPIA